MPFKEDLEFVTIERFIVSIMTECQETKINQLHTREAV